MNISRNTSLPAIVLTDAEHHSLVSLASEAEERLPGVGEALLSELDRAEIVAESDLPADVVRMGSSVLFRSDDGQQREVTLVYPAKADIAEGKISVMTPIGAALIGMVLTYERRYDEAIAQLTTTLEMDPALPTAHIYMALAYLRRGDPDNKEGVATQSFLQVLMPGPDAEKRWQTPPPAGWRTSYRRRALAEWLTDVERGAGALLARVIVNRLWQHHLGHGIVATPSDFGVRGQPPSHPELLDYLAKRFIDGGWLVKAMHRAIMLTDAYQRASEDRPHEVQADPENVYLWQFARRRLSAEEVRDAILMTAGTLDKSRSSMQRMLMAAVRLPRGSTPSP